VKATGNQVRAAALLLALSLALTACSTTVISTFEVVASPSGNVPSVSASSSGPLEGRWATGPIPIADIKAAMIAAGIAAADVDAWVIEVGSPSEYSFVLEFTGQTFTHSEETPDMPMEVGESGTFTLSGTELVLKPGEAGNLDSYTLAASLSGNDLSLQWVASTEQGSAEAKETHRRFTIAFYCSAVFKRAG
jgi:hypothetical protein